MGTKDKILEAALDLFSRCGFTAVSVREIAAAVGVKESAMYRHFSNKHAVFDQLLTNYLVKSKTYMASIHALPSGDPEHMKRTVLFYGQLADKDFLRLGGSVFTDFLMLPDILKFWRMISIERINDKNLANLWKTHLFDEPIAFQTEMFGLLTRIGIMRLVDPRILALEFFSPLLLLYLQALPFEPDGDEFAYFLDFANQHMKHFRETYSHKVEEV